MFPNNKRVKRYCLYDATINAESSLSRKISRNAPINYAYRWNSRVDRKRALISLALNKPSSHDDDKYIKVTQLQVNETQPHK